MAKSKPRRDKKYRPKPCVKPLGMRSAVSLEMPGYQASVALGQGHFEEQHVYDLLSSVDMVRRIAPDGHSVLPIAQGMVMAIAEIQARAQRTGKHGATGDEMRVLRDGIGAMQEYIRSVPNVDIWRASKAAVDEFDRTGVLRV